MKEGQLMDVLYVGTMILFFAVCIAYTAFLGRLAP